MNSIIKDFIVIEGIDGAGTTTQKGRIESYLRGIGRNAVSTFEPTDKEIGRLIRAVLRSEIRMPDLSLAMLYAADRANHLYGEGGIIENTEKGNIVISDRYFYSSLAYQSLNLDYGKIESLNDYPHPEYLIFLDVDVKTCIERIEKRGEKKEIFEKESLLERIRENYLRSFENLPGSVKFLSIAGNKAIEETTEIIKDFLSF